MNEHQDKPDHNLDKKSWYLGNIPTSPDILLAWIRGQAERKFLTTKSFRLDELGTKFQLFLHNEVQLFEGIITYEWGWVELSQASVFTSQITIVAETKYTIPVEQVEERSEFFDWLLELINNTWDCSSEHQSTIDSGLLEGEDHMVPEGLPKKSTTQSGENEKDNLLPKTDVALKRWKDIYQLVVKQREEYLEDFKSLETENPKPTYDDIRDNIAFHKGEKPGERTLRKIIKAGDKGWLK